MQIKQYSVIFIIVILFLIGCKPDKVIEQSCNYRLNKTAEINSEKNEYSDLGTYKIYNNLIYVADNELCEVNIFDLNGNFVRKFGNKGHGPGEFQFIKNILFIDNSIVIFDYKRKKMIEFDKNLKLISEFDSKKGNLSHEIRNFDGNYYAVIMSLNGTEKLNYCKGLFKIDRSFSKIDTLIQPYEYEFNPLFFDSYKGTYYYSMSNKSRSFIYSLINYKEVKITFVDYQNDKEKSFTFDNYKPVLLNERIRESMIKRYSEIRKLYPQVQTAEVPKYRASITSLTFDQNDNIWVSSPHPEPDKRNLLIFSKNGDYQGRILVDDSMQHIQIENNHLINLNLNDENDKKIEIFEIVKSSE